MPPLIPLEHSEEGLLRERHFAKLLHPLLARLLLFEQLIFARHVAAVQLRRHILAKGRERLAGDDRRPDRRLDRDQEVLPRDDLL